MKIDNSLSQEFLLSYPAEAARILEQVSAEDVAALLIELPPQTATTVMASMLPRAVATCLEKMTPVNAAKLLSALPESSAARINHLLAPKKQEEVSSHLSDKIKNHLRRYFEYPLTSAGALMDSEINMLPDNITVADAIRRIERLGRSPNCELYVIDDVHHLVGMIVIGRLLTSSHHAKLRDVMNRKTQPLSAHATAESLLHHPGWLKQRRLPVIERDKTLVGVLDHIILQEKMKDIGPTEMRDPLDNFLSLAGLYWLSVAQMLDSVMGMSGRSKGERR